MIIIFDYFDAAWIEALQCEQRLWLAMLGVIPIPYPEYYGA